MPVMENAYALVVGIAAYHHINTLPQAVTQDASDIYQLLIDPHYCGYVAGHVQILLDDQATLAALRQAFVQLAQQSNQDSTIFVYISSHGGRTASGEYVLPVDAVYDSDETIAQTALSGTEVTALLRAVPARKAVVIFDCCHAGGIGQPKAGAASSLKAGLSEQYYETLQSGRGRVIFASSRSEEYSYLQPGASNSLFTHHVLEGLRGSAPGIGGVIRIFDLFHYVQPRVTAERADQHPLFKAEIEENFPVTLSLGGKAPAPLPPALPAGNFHYDVFLNYRNQEPDQAWVRKTLLPALEAQGLRVCIDCRDFRLGLLLLKEMERAVEQSRYTLAVLSPAYLKSNFTELENVLAAHLGLEHGQRRLLMIMRQACTPRLGMRASLWLDMTDDDEFDLHIARLVYALRQPPDL